MSVHSIGVEATYKLSESLAVNSALNTLAIDGICLFDDCFIILSAIHNNHTMITLTLPCYILSTNEYYALHTEIEKINIIRRSQNIDMLNVIFFDELSN